MFNFTGLAALVKEEFGPGFIDEVRRLTPFMEFLSPKKRQYTQKDIRWKINYAGNSSVGSYSETGSLGTPGEQAYTTASLDWKLNKALVRVTGLAQAVSQSPNSLIDAMSQEIESALKDLKRNMELQLLSDGVGNLNGANPALDGTGLDLTGIQAGIDDGSAVTTYAGINRAANIWWQSYVLANSGTARPVTETLMFQCVNEVENRGGRVTHILCSPNVWVAYANLLTAERRQVNHEYELHGGWKMLDFSGIPVVRVPFYEEGRMDFMDIDQCNWHMLVDFTMEPRDPGNYDASQFFIKQYSQFAYENPYYAASLRDLQSV